jgi:hypothetical protein
MAQAIKDERFTAYFTPEQLGLHAGPAITGRIPLVDKIAVPIMSQITNRNPRLCTGGTVR